MTVLTIAALTGCSTGSSEEGDMQIEIRVGNERFTACVIARDS